MGNRTIHIIKKTAKWLVYAFFALLLSSLIAIYLYAPKYLNNNLSEIVQKKTNGLYSFSFDNLNLSLRYWGFELEHINLQVNDSVLNTLDSIAAKKSIYYFNSPKIQIKNIQLIKFFAKNEIEIGSFEIVEPQFKVSGGTDNENNLSNNAQSIFKELYPLLSNKIQSIKIKNIELIDANYDFYDLLGDTGKVSNAEHITIGLSNFYTDSVFISDPTRLFDADDVFIKMSNYENWLSDSLHVIKAEELLYSFKQANITGKNVTLKPEQSNRIDKNRYEVKVPYLKIKSEHIHEFFYTDSIKIDSLYLKNAEINFYPKAKSTAITMDNIYNFDLYDLIRDEFKSISIHDFLLDDSELSLFNYRTQYFLQQELNHLKIRLQNFYLDKSSVKDRTKIFYSDNLSISAKDYRLNLADNKHKLNAKSIYASTFDQRIQIDDIHLNPINEDSIRQIEDVAIFIDCDSLKVNGTDLKQAFHYRTLPLRAVEIYKPKTRINKYDLKIEKVQRKNSIAYDLISDYFSGIYASLVTVDNGKLEINSLEDNNKLGYMQSGIAFQLTDFALDSISDSKSEKLFFATNINLDFTDYQMKLVDQLHQLNIKEIEISSIKKRVNIRHAHLFPITKENPDSLLNKFKRTELYEIKIPYLFLYNSDIHQAFFNKKLTISNFRVVEPKIEFESYAGLKRRNKSESESKEFIDLLENYIKDVNIKQIEVIDGKLKLTNHNKRGNTIRFDNKFNLKLDNFRLNENEIGKRRLLFSDAIDLKLEKYLFKLSDNVHYLQAGEIGLSTFNNHIYVKNAIFYPDITHPRYKKIPWNIHIRIPSISLSGVDLPKMYFDKKLTAKQFVINQADINLYRMSAKAKNVDFKQLKISFIKGIDLLQIGNLEVNNGELKAFRFNDTNPDQFLETGINMHTKNLKIAKDHKKRTSEILSGIFSTTLNNLLIEPLDKNQKIGIETIHYSTNSQNIDLNKVEIAPKLMNEENDHYKLIIPQLQLTSFNIDKAYEDNIFDFKQIVLDKPSFTFFRNTSDSSTFNPYKTSLYKYFKDFADVFTSNKLTLKDARFEFNQGKNNIAQNGVNLTLRNFNVTPANTNKFLHSDDFEFSFNDVEKEDAKHQYILKMNSVNFSSSDSNLTVRGIKLIPKYTKEKFSKIIDFQKDYFTGNLDELKYENLDLRRWFEKKEFVGSRINLQNLNLDVYRDKRVKFNEAQRPPMPQDLIKNLNFNFYFDSLTISNANISYAERIQESLKAGKVDFKNLNASLKPFTNIKYLRNTLTTLQASAKLMNGPMINTSMAFDLSSATNEFEVVGSIEPFQLNLINPMVEPAALMKISSGELNRFEFNFEGNNESSNGKLKFAYDDLKISILEIKDGSTKKLGFSSFMANSLMIKSKNPRSKILLPEEIDYERDQKRSILNFWWKSVFDGIKNTFGINDKKKNNK